MSQRIGQAVLWLAALVSLVMAFVAPAYPEIIAQRTSQSITTSGTDCTTSTNCVVLSDAFRTVGLSVQLAGTWTGTAQFEATVDGTNWTALLVTPFGTTTAVTSATSNGAWSVPTIAVQGVRIRASALSAGSITASIIAR